jgi:hypothetical protein
MVDPFPGVPYSFGALRKTFGPLWVRCDVCRRYARLFLRELRDVDYRTKTFSCSICGANGALALEEPCKDTGMEDYRLDQRVDPKHHSAAVKRMTEPRRRSPRQRRAARPQDGWPALSSHLHRGRSACTALALR